MISMSRCLLMLVTVTFLVETFLMGLPWISLPRYFITCWRGFPFTRLDSTRARYVADFVFIFLMNGIVVYSLYTTYKKLSEPA